MPVFNLNCVQFKPKLSIRTWNKKVPYSKRNMGCGTAEISHLWLVTCKNLGMKTLKMVEGGRFTDVAAAKQVIIQCHIFQTGETYTCLYRQWDKTLWSLSCWLPILVAARFYEVYFYYCIIAYHASVGHCELATEHIFLTVLYNRMFHNVYMLISNFWWLYTYTYGLFGNTAISQTIKGWMVGWLGEKLLEKTWNEVVIV